MHRQSTWARRRVLACCTAVPCLAAPLPTLHCSPLTEACLVAIFARREVAAVDRLLQERILAVGPELADVRIGLDDSVPELVLVVAEQLLLLDLLDVDVVHRSEPVVERDRTADGVELDPLHGLDEFERARILAAVLLHHLVDPLR